MSTGLSGTPMPSYSDSCRRRTAGRWPTTSSRCRPSRIPLTGAPLQIREEDRQALNDPATQARTSDTAYVPMSDRAYAGREEGRYGGAAWAQRHGIELLPETLSAATGR